MQLSLCFVALLAVADAGIQVGDHSYGSDIMEALSRPTLKEYKKANADKAAKDAGKAADNGKTAAVDKVIQMLADLATTVRAEGIAEAKSYNKFVCFCQEMEKAKDHAIKEEKDAKRSLRASIEKLTTGKKKDKKTIKGLEKNIVDTNDDETKADKDNADAAKAYADEKADFEKAISSTRNALKTLKASKPSLLQVQATSSAVDEAMAMADAFGLVPSAGASLLQAPEVEMENYKGHSDGVVGILEKALHEFREKKAKSDSTEVARVMKYDMTKQSYANRLKAKTLEAKETGKEKDGKTVNIADDNQKLKTETAELLDDEDYLKELFKMCKKKAETWDERSKVRTDELSALIAAADIVKGAVRAKTSSSTIRFAQRGVSVRIAQAIARDDGAMDALEEAAEEKEAVVFLQERSVSLHTPEDENRAGRISELLQTAGMRAKSAALTSLALEISAEKPRGMEKISTLISELIKRLQAKAANAATQKGFCDKGMGDANRKKSSATSAITELDDSLGKLQADKKIVSDAIKTLTGETKELNAAQAKADQMRKEEKTESAATILEAKEGLAAVKSAIGILDGFYNKAAKNENKEFKTTKKVADNSPKAGFAGGEAYKGSQDKATGVISMLDVIKSDFVRTIVETEKSEDLAVQDYKAMTDTTQTSIKEKTAITKARKKEKSDAESRIHAQKKALKRQKDTLDGALQELEELNKVCVATQMSYKERVARREDEIASLNQALKLL